MNEQWDVETELSGSGADPIPIRQEGPQPLLRETPPADPYPLDALGPFKDAAAAAQDITQAPLALAAQSALSVASLAAQAHWNVESLGGPKPVSLFCLSVAQSGERKSACDRQLMRPVDKFSRDLSSEYQMEIEKHKAASTLWQARQKNILRQPKPDETEADLAALGPEPKPPLLPLVTASDPTVEGITRTLGISRPSLGLFSDEGGAFLGGSGMSEDNRLKTVATLSGFWDGSPINRTRASDGSVTHFGKRLALHLMVQPIAAETLLADPVATGQGFLARFLIVQPPSTMGRRLFRDAKPESIAALEAWDSRIGSMLRTEPRLREESRNEIEPAQMSLVPAARQILIRFHDTVELELPSGKALEACQAFASKAAEHAARIAGVMTAFAGEASVTARTMADAVTLAEYYLGEAARLADAATISKETVKLERLRKWLVESWDEAFISPAIAAQFGPFRETSANKKLLGKLAEHGHVCPIEGGTMVRDKHRREAFRIVRV